MGNTKPEKKGTKRKQKEEEKKETKVASKKVGKLLFPHPDGRKRFTRKRKLHGSFKAPLIHTWTLVFDL